MNNQELVVVQALLNSLALDFYIRNMVSANINMFYIYQLPVPRLTKNESFFDDIVTRAAKLICTTDEFADLWNVVMDTPWTPECGTTDEAESWEEVARWMERLTKVREEGFYVCELPEEDAL